MNALLARLQRSGATLALEEPLRDLTVREPGFALTTPQRVVSAARVILTTGGQSYPGSGTTGDGYRLAAQFGHTIVPPRPALVPITTDAAVGRGTARHHAARRRRAHPRKGQAADRRARFAAVRPLRPVRAGHSRRQPRRQRPSGTAVVAAGTRLLPAMKEADLDEWLRVETGGGRQEAARGRARQSCCRGGCAMRCCRRRSWPVDRKAAALSKPERQRLAGCVKRSARSDHRHARLRQGGGDGRRRGPRRSRFAHHAEQACAASVSSPAKCSTSTARSAATTFRPPGAPAGSPVSRRRRRGTTFRLDSGTFWS